MTGETKDLSHYIENPDELGDLSDAQLEALADNQGPTDATPAEDKGDTASAATPGDTAGTQKDGDDKQPDGVLARDGKHIIPYSRLEDAERRARENEQRARDLEQRLKDATEGGTSSEATQDDHTQGLMSDAELDELEAELPALAKVIRAQQAQIKAMADKVAHIEGAGEAASKQSAEEAWSAALAQNPKAAYLDATLSVEDGDRFINAAAALYDDWNTMTADQRADAIVRQYEAVRGPIKVASIATQQPGAKAPARPDVPLSMSGIPGGAAPAVDEAAAMANKTGAELTHDFMAMSPEQIEAALARL